MAENNIGPCRVADPRVAEGSFHLPELGTKAVVLTDKGPLFAALHEFEKILCFFQIVRKGLLNENIFPGLHGLSGVRDMELVGESHNNKIGVQLQRLIKVRVADPVRDPPFLLCGLQIGAASADQGHKLAVRLVMDILQPTCRPSAAAYLNYFHCFTPICRNV